MTDDIIARLRQPIVVDVHPVSLHAKTMREAADEIERLRAELAKERERADAHYRVLECVSSKRDELRAELAARDALLREVRDEFKEIVTISDRATLTWKNAWVLIDRIDALLNGGGDE